MNYSKMISVSGLPGLYELLTSKADGAVVRSLEDKSTKFVSSRVHNFSHLESIEIYTTKNNTNLADIFKAIGESKEPLPGTNADGKQLKAYFEKVYPDLDFERVYSSDMKKMIKWFQLLKANDVEIKLKEEGDEEEIEGEEKGVIEEIKNEVPQPEEESLKNSK